MSLGSVHKAMKEVAIETSCVDAVMIGGEPEQS
jgi:hypothetical protein